MSRNLMLNGVYAINKGLIMFTITENGLKNLRMVVYDFYKISLDIEWFRARIYKFEMEIEDFAEECEDNSIRDLCPRELVGNVIAREFTNHAHFPHGLAPASEKRDFWDQLDTNLQLYYFKRSKLLEDVW